MEISSIGSVLESARDFTLEAASSAAQFIEGMSTDSDIPRLLASTSAREQSNGLRMVLAEASRGQAPNHGHFAAVVKCASSQDASVRRMVYQFITTYGVLDPNLALMTVNAVQKTLLDKNPVTRSLALKTISGLPVVSVAPIVAMNVRSMSTDQSPLVRKTVARALAKCYNTDSSVGSDLLPILEKLLLDKSPSVQGAALAVLAQTFPNRIDLLHKPFRSICENLRGFDVVSQAPALRILLRYARHFMGPDYKDVKLLLAATEPLLKSQSSDTIVAVASLYFYLSEGDIPSKVAAAVAALSPSELVLENIVVLAKHHDKALRPWIKRFYLTPADTAQQMDLKLRVIALLVDEKTLKHTLKHLQFYAQAVESPDTVGAVFQTIAACASRANAIPKIIRWLVNLVSNGTPSPPLVSNALLSLRVLLQQGNTSGKTLQHLASLLNHDLLPSEARATILWLVGEASGNDKALACEVLRTSIKDMALLDTPVRLQIVQLAAKLYSHYLNDTEGYDARVPALFEHVIYLGKYDPDYDNRDRCRMFSSLLSDQHHDLATLLLQAHKPPPSIDVDDREEYVLGSSALAAGRPLLYYISLEDWGRKDPTLRDVATPVAETPAYSEIKQISRETAPRVPLPQKSKKILSLQEFLQSADGESESSEEETSEEEGSSDEDSDEEDEHTSSG